MIKNRVLFFRYLDHGPYIPTQKNMCMGFGFGQTPKTHTQKTQNPNAKTQTQKPKKNWVKFQVI